MRAFRHFRIFQTGPNSSGNNSLSCNGIELYGTYYGDQPEELLTALDAAENPCAGCELFPIMSHLLVSSVLLSSSLSFYLFSCLSLFSSCLFFLFRLFALLFCFSLLLM